MREWLKEYWQLLLCIIFLLFCMFIPFYGTKQPSLALKDYKDGIQNHLTWSIKGECFFVRPNDDVTVYLVRVPDCDRK